MNPLLTLELQRRREQGLYRTRKVVDSPQGVELIVDGRRVLSFCSNDYLALANHPEVVAALHAGADRYGVGSGAAHLVSGHSRAHHELEEALAAFTGRARALLFSTGYMANLGVVGALLGRRDAVFEDRLNHASLIDAGQLSGARLHRYGHGDTVQLARYLETAAGRKLIVTDGVFSMDGDIAPLPELSMLARRHDAWLMVDDAHGFGVLGRAGGGVAEQYGLGVYDIPILMGTLGKAFGTFGAFVAADEALIETLIQQARPYVYTTALPPAVAMATLASLRLAQEDDWRRHHLSHLVQHFRRGAAQLGLDLLPSETPIQPVVLGEAERAVAVSERLLAQGILVTAIRPPTVPKGTSRLRITFTAAHSEAHVDRLLDALEEGL